MHEVETMFSAREVPWHGLGNVTPDELGSDDAIKVSGLDWLVESRPIYLVSKDTEADNVASPIEGYAAFLRDSDDSLLQVARESYTPIQNFEMFEFVEALTDDPDVTFDTAGSLRNG